MKNNRQGSSFNLRPVIFIVSIFPGWILCMTLGLFGYDKTAGTLAANFYSWCMKGRQ